MEYKNDVIGVKPENGCGKDGCDKECKVYTNVRVPVEIEPDAKFGRIEAECCGDPEVNCECSHDGAMRVVISQNLFIKIPVSYSVKVRTGKSQTECQEGKEQ